MKSAFNFKFTNFSFDSIPKNKVTGPSLFGKARYAYTHEKFGTSKPEPLVKKSRQNVHKLIEIFFKALTVYFCFINYIF